MTETIGGRVTESGPSTAKEWAWWARDVEPLLRRHGALTKPQGRMLKAIAVRADRRGSCTASAARLGEDIGVGERQAERLLAGLRRVGLVDTARGARGARRRLCPGVVPGLMTGQMSFDDLLADTTPAPAPASSVPVAPAVPRSVAPPVVPAAPDPTFSGSDPTSGCRAKVNKELQEEARPREDARRSVLQPRLDDVVEILEGSPGLVVDPLAVNSALAAYPEARGHDHLRAAHTVASRAFEGVWHSRSANGVLMGVLREQSSRSVSQPGRWHGGRRRCEPPMSPAMVEQTDRETAAMRRVMAAAGFGVR